ncbi:hypothetical protein ABPG75_010673 [Micractinium tetrahymenae]
MLMDSWRGAAQLRACVRNLNEWFQAADSYARRVRLHSRLDAANELATLLRVLDTEGHLAERVKLLMTLVDSLSVVATAAAKSTRQDQDAFGFASGWTALLAGSLVVGHNLLIRAGPHLATAEQRQRLAAAVPAVAYAAATLCQQLPRLRQDQPAAFAAEQRSRQLVLNLDECMRLLFQVLAACLDVASAGIDGGHTGGLADLLRTALPTKWTLSTLLRTIGAVEWTVSSAGARDATCVPSLFQLLSRFVDANAPVELPQALCNDARLLGRLARITAGTHAAIVAKPDWQNSSWRLRQDIFIGWSGRWCYLPLATSLQQAAVLPLLVAAGSMLKAEVALLASLPAQPLAGADPQQAEQLARCWLFNQPHRPLPLPLN